MRNSNPSSSSSSPVTIALILFLIPMVVYILDPANSSTFFPPPPPPSVLLGSVKHSPKELHASLERVSEESLSLSAANSSFNGSPPPSPPPSEADLIKTKHAWHISPTRAVEECSILDKVEAGLAKARAVIREAALNGKLLSSPEPDPDYVPRGPIYRNPHAFHRYNFHCTQHLSFFYFLFIFMLIDVFPFLFYEILILFLKSSPDQFSSSNIFLGFCYMCGYAGACVW
ncbi:probable glycosyltransferase At5g03795 isoform X2 [Magnolia sinica]|uniref:probable glycosyltransferase At5g03795 isoform X2 n=1 Tax=Magnolia sinica TaxID=86752 RepID=UPI002657B2FA|nr:probable glycosyltransferase At5g03795 isoform X2 [Magnolia sinica]